MFTAYVSNWFSESDQQEALFPYNHTLTFNLARWNVSMLTSQSRAGSWDAGENGSNAGNAVETRTMRPGLRPFV